MNGIAFLEASALELREYIQKIMYKQLRKLPLDSRNILLNQKIVYGEN
jgi:hypothetical protein